MTHEELIEAKRRSGYSTAQLAEKTHIPVGTLNKLLSGVTKNPRRDTILALERFFIEDDGWLGKKGSFYYENADAGTLMVHQGASLQEDNLKLQGTYTIEDYKNLPEGIRMELIDGCMYTMECPTFTHQMIIQEVFGQIDSFIKRQNGACFVSNMSMDIYLTENENTVVIPDLFVLCDRNKMKEDGVHGAPDFILEVLSRATRGKDLFIKSLKYNDAGVRELWIIDPVKQKLYLYDFETQTPPSILPLSGKQEMKIYHGELSIDLDGIMNSVRRFYEKS